MKTRISYSVIFFLNECIQGHYFCILSSISLYLLAACSVSAKLKNGEKSRAFCDHIL